MHHTAIYTESLLSSAAPASLQSWILICIGPIDPYVGGSYIVAKSSAKQLLRKSLSSPDDRYCKRLRDPLIFLQLNLCALSFRHESGVDDATSATHHECYMPFLDGRANRAAECRCAPNCNSQFCISRRRREPHKHHLQCLRFQSSQLLHLSAGLPIAR